MARWTMVEMSSLGYRINAGYVSGTISKALGICALIWFGLVSAIAGTVPTARIDPSTGHKIIRVSDEPGSYNLYFNYNAFTPDGDVLVFSSPTGISTFNFKTMVRRKVVSGKVHLLFVGRRTADIYYVKDGTLYALSLVTGATREVCGLFGGRIETINSDETLVAGIIEQRDARSASLNRLPKLEMMKKRIDLKSPTTIFTVDLRNGEKRDVLQTTDWITHVQFSPVDPALMMYCHEGPWEKVDRIWVRRIDRPDATSMNIHVRRMQNEISGHEWFSRDGKTIWYDLQTPANRIYWVAGYEVGTGKRVWYNLAPNEWSVHYNSAGDDRLFAGDGNPRTDGKWIYLFTPHIDHSDTASPPGDNPLIATGVVSSEKLVNMQNHDYSIEPNVNFSPDGRWVIFTSTMEGNASQVYAVETKR